MTTRHTVLLLAGLWQAVPAAGLADVTTGSFTVRPKISVEAGYDTNIFLSRTATASAILKAGPGLGIVLNDPRTLLALGYELAFLNYAKFPKANNAIHQTAALSVLRDFAGGNGRVGADELFLATTDPASSELTERAKRNQNDAAVKLDLPLTPKTFLGVNASDETIDYRRADISAFLDRNEFYPGARLGYRPTEKTRAYAFYRYAAISYKGNSSADSTGHLGGGGVEGDFSARLTGTIEAGVVNRTYSRTLSGEPNKISTARATASLKWMAPSEWSIVLEGGRIVREGLFNRYFMENTASVSITKRLGPQLEAQLLGSWGQDQFPGNIHIADLTNTVTGDAFVKRNDTVMSGGVRLSYRLEDHQTLTLRYLFRSRMSTVDVFKYEDQVATLSGDYAF